MKTYFQRPITVIFHGNCPDGFASALAAQLFFKQQDGYKQFKDNIIYHKGIHGTTPPDCQDRDVYIVDFSYKRNDITALCQQAAKVTIIDHHISALNDLAGLDEECENLHFNFDMNQSGAVLTWKYFHQDAPVPKLFQHVQDNDLWRFELDNTQTIILAIMSYPMRLKLWSSWLIDDKALDVLHQEGLILERETKRQIKRYKKASRMGKIAGHIVPLVNAPSSIGSELLHQLSDGYPFAAAYEDKAEKRVWQLRSGGDKAIDVSKIALQFGGGGHKNASGFSTERINIELHPKNN
ncbi:phosphoesterase [sulfur-oxidizing endosymbiont of Gigantopelta aegis]|uniref:phosphoesterase n=1 Tax=sulfur-oxidizing endosymbiont of Gigantopelta aegis TaxID=2794934 RepID=UPI0018DE8C83|nr:phosphoesterase [sulfur-oxidizing endosymbiont of Gigantopelta aegis]